MGNTDSVPMGQVRTRLPPPKSAGQGTVMPLTPVALQQFQARELSALGIKELPKRPQRSSRSSDGDSGGGTVRGATNGHVIGVPESNLGSSAKPHGAVPAADPSPFAWDAALNEPVLAPRPESGTSQDSGSVCSGWSALVPAAPPLPPARASPDHHHSLAAAETESRDHTEGCEPDTDYDQYHITLLDASGDEEQSYADYAPQLQYSHTEEGAWAASDGGVAAGKGVANLKSHSTVTDSDSVALSHRAEGEDRSSRASGGRSESAPAPPQLYMDDRGALYCLSASEAMSNDRAVEELIRHTKEEKAASSSSAGSGSRPRIAPAASRMQVPMRPIVTRSAGAWSVSRSRVGSGLLGRQRQSSGPTPVSPAAIRRLIPVTPEHKKSVQSLANIIAARKQRTRSGVVGGSRSVGGMGALTRSAPSRIGSVTVRRPGSASAVKALATQSKSTAASGASSQAVSADSGKRSSSEKSPRATTLRSASPGVEKASAVSTSQTGTKSATSPSRGKGSSSTANKAHKLRRPVRVRTIHVTPSFVRKSKRGSGKRQPRSSQVQSSGKISSSGSAKSAGPANSKHHSNAASKGQLEDLKEAVGMELLNLLEELVDPADQATRAGSVSRQDSASTAALKSATLTLSDVLSHGARAGASTQRLAGLPLHEESESDVASCSPAVITGKGTSR